MSATKKKSAKDLWPLKFKLNGKSVTHRVDPTQTLLDFLRIELGLTGSKGACLEGECGKSERDRVGKSHQ